jgi:DNA invertase Pin-like site-specific DNA recombinase
MAYRKTWRGWPHEEPGYSLVIAGRVCDAYFRVSDNPDANDQRSISDQRDAWYGWTERVVVQRGGEYADDNESASEFRGGGERPDFARLLAGIRAGRLDGHLLWVWASNRLTRGDISLDVIAAECAAHGIVWVFNGQVLNPAHHGDLSTAEMQNMVDKQQPRKMREDVRRGKASSARQGRPNAVPLYGYRRVYQTDAGGRPVLVKGRPVIDHDEPAEPAISVVREIFSRIEAGDTLSAIRASLEDRRIPAPRFPRKCTSCGYRLGKEKRCPHGHEQDLCQWHVSAVRFIATNIGYLGKRIHHAESARLADRRRAVLDDVTAMWPAAVSEQQFRAVQRILSDASRVRWTSPNRGNSAGKPPAREYVLVPAARCAGCGAALGGHSEPNGDWYKCRTRGCVSVRADWLEAWAEDRLVSWLVLPEVRSRIFSTAEDADTRRAAAEAALADLHEELAEARELFEQRKMTPVAFSRYEMSTLAAIEAEQAKMADAPQYVLDMMHPDAADRWVALRAGSPHAARQLMAEVATIYVHPAATRGGGVTRGFDESRVEWHWKIGEDATAGPTREGCTERLAARRAALDAARERAAGLLRADPSQADAAIGRQAGCSYGTVGRIRRQLTEAGDITDPGYRTGANGKLYRSTGNGTAAAPRKNVSEGPVTRRPDHVTAKRARIAAALAEHPDWSHYRISQVLGVAHGTVESTCAETGGECGHGRTGQGSRRDLAPCS